MSSQLMNIWTMTPREKKKEFERRYGLLMPIDSDIDPGLCRDTFLQTLFKEVDLPDYEKLPSTPTAKSTTSSEQVLAFPKAFTDNMSLSTMINKSAAQIRSGSTLRLEHPRPTLHGSSLLFSILSGHTDVYDELLRSLKQSSLYFMFSRTINRFRIMGRISTERGAIDLHDLPHDLFRWSFEGYFKRCALPDTVYLDVLQMKHSDEMLDWAKFSTDISEIIRYYKFFYTQTFLHKGYRSLMATIWDQEQLIDFDRELNKTLLSTQQTLNNVTRNSRKVSDAWWGRHRYKMAKDCQIRRTEISMLLPIQWRYVRDYFAVMTEMQILKDRQPIEKLRNECNKLKEETQQNDLTHKQGLLVYSMVIEGYEARLNHFNSKLNNDSAEWDDKNITINIQINKVREDQRVKQEAIAFMQRRVIEVQELLTLQKEAIVDRLITANKHVSIVEPKLGKTKGRQKKVRGVRRKNTVARIKAAQIVV